MMIVGSCEEADASAGEMDSGKQMICSHSSPKSRFGISMQVPFMWICKLA